VRVWHTQQVTEEEKRSNRKVKRKKAEESGMALRGRGWSVGDVVDCILGTVLLVVPSCMPCCTLFIPPKI
jgi:hypothetical protein